MALSFDIIDGTPYLITKVGHLCIGSDDKIRGLRVITWNATKLVELPVASAPLDRLKYNLHREYQGRKDGDDTHGHQTLAMKRYGWRGPDRFGADPNQGKPLLNWRVLLGGEIRSCEQPQTNPIRGDHPQVKPLVS